MGFCGNVANCGDQLKGTSFVTIGNNVLLQQPYDRHNTLTHCILRQQMPWVFCVLGIIQCNLRTSIFCSTVILLRSMP